MTKSHTSKILMLMGLLPFLYALVLALYNAINVADYIGISYTFARIDSYIYSHSFGVVFFSMLTGLQLGLAFGRKLSPLYFIANIFIFSLAWASFLSYANKYGLTVLMMAYIADLITGNMANKEQQIPYWFWRFKIKMNGSIISLLVMLILINQ